MHRQSRLWRTAAGWCAGICLLGCGAPATEPLPAVARVPAAPVGPEASRRHGGEEPPAAPVATMIAPGRNAPPRDISFDDIKLDMKKGDPFSRDLLPAKVTALEHGRIRIRGYILPSFQQTGLTQFVLVRDNMECCFGPGALLHDCIVVRMVPGKSASFSIRPVAVTGTFRIDELRGPDGRHLAIYALDGDDVQ